MTAAEAGLAAAYAECGNYKLALGMERELYVKTKSQFNEEHFQTLNRACNLISFLTKMRHLAEAVSFACKQLQVARCALGSSHELTLALTHALASALAGGSRFADAVSRSDLVEAVGLLGDSIPLSRRVLGADHFTTMVAQKDWKRTKAYLASKQAPAEEVD